MRANHFRQERVLITDQRYQKHMFPALYHISKSNDVGEMKNSPIPVSDTGSLGMADNTTQIEVAKSPCGESHAFHLKHITPGSQQANNVHKSACGAPMDELLRLFPRASEVAGSILSSCRVGSDRVNGKRLLPHTPTPTGWISRPREQDLGSYKRHTRP